MHRFQGTLPRDEGIRAGLTATVVERIENGNAVFPEVVAFSPVKQYSLKVDKPDPTQGRSQGGISFNFIITLFVNGIFFRTCKKASYYLNLFINLQRYQIKILNT